MRCGLTLVFADELYGKLSRLHRRIKSAHGLLSREPLRWRPFPTGSYMYFYVLILHVYYNAEFCKEPVLYPWQSNYVYITSVRSTNTPPITHTKIALQLIQTVKKPLVRDC